MMSEYIKQPVACGSVIGCFIKEGRRTLKACNILYEAFCEKAIYVVYKKHDAL